MVAAVELWVRSHRRRLSRPPVDGERALPDRPETPTRPQLRLRADAFVALAGDALVVRVAERWSRVRSEQPSDARTIHAALRGSGVLGPDVGARELVGRLVHLGALEPYVPPLVWDRLGVLERLTVSVVSASTFEREAPHALLADRSDPSLGPALEALGERAVLLGLLAPGRVIVARSGGLAAGFGCPRCAWLGERDQVSDVPPVPVEPAPAAHGARAWAALRCAQLLDAALLELDELPPGHAWVERVGAARRTLAIARHPACACWRGATAVADATFESLEGRAFAPVWPVERGSAETSARVVFRRSARGDVVSPATLGVALGSGAARETLALAESIERSAMHHGPPDVLHARRDDLDEPVLASEQLASLLFRPDERSADGFRFPALDTTSPIHWSRARALGGGAEVLVPAALVGHVPLAQRFVPATSNGYACHHDERAAVLGALLELVERDALLLSWFLGRAWQRLSDVDSVGATFLCTQDVDLPVVFACACAEDGSLRSGSAAALDLDTAVARAQAERAVALAGNPTPTRRPPLERVDVAHGPEDHLARVAGPAGRVAFETIAGRATTTRRRDADRWPKCDADLVETVAGALAERGLEAWIVDRSMPPVFCAGWRVVRAIVPGLVELSF